MVKHAVAEANSADSETEYRRVISRCPDKVNPEKMVLKLDGGESFSERRFLPVSKQDKVRCVNGADKWVSLRKMEGEVRVSPEWRCEATIRINGKKIPLEIKEISAAHEMRGYELLTRFHYRGAKFVGRRVPLIATISRWNLPEVVGFVELSTSMLVNVARKKILGAPFHDPGRQVRWEQWDMDTAKEYNNVLVRIARCVVYPELRGLGLAAILSNAAVEYARERWHVGGMRPCFIEIVAEMLRYWPFVEKCGFVKVGETEGNDKRAPQAMKYLLTRKMNGDGYPKGGGGIMSMHRKNAEKLAQMRERQNLSVEDVVNLLRKDPGKLGIKQWVALHDFYRRKKPTYMRGLTPSAEKHLLAQTEKSAPKKRAARLRGKVLATVGKMRITAKVKPQNSRRCREIQEAFGIVSGEFRSEIIRDFSCDFKSGEIYAVTGPSGAGKSLFLAGIQKILNNGKSARLPEGISADGKNRVKNVRVARLQTPPRNQSPIEILKKHSLDDAMRILAGAGLAEAQLFVRPSRFMSVGQSYRLALAVALAKKPDIMLIDEFCEPLDEYTAAAVCRKINRAAKTDGMCFITAAADFRKVSRELKPNRVLLLSANGGWEFLTKMP